MSTAHLVAELDVLRARLRGADEAELDAAQEVLDAARERLTGPSPLDEVTAGFGLTPFERSVLLLAAGPELVATVADELVSVCGAPALTFGVALAVLPEAHWSALTPPAPLRRWHLVRLLDPDSALRSPLAVDERVLHHIAGAGHLDVQLAAVVRDVPAPRWLPAPMREASAALHAAWAGGRAGFVHGPQPANLRAVAAAAAAMAGLRLLEVDVADLARDGIERAMRLLERETVLGAHAWAITLDGGTAEQVAALARALPGLDAPATVLGTDIALAPREATAVAVPRLEVAERRAALDAALARHGAGADAVDVAAGIFDLTLDDLDAAAADVARGSGLWQACRERARPAFGGLATVLRPRATWSDLVLPAAQLEQLHALAAAVRHRATVLDDWGFAARSARGTGTTALFTGPSGTGKTLAAEVLAHDLGLDLVQVDLSQVVSKYIGETEKQLRRLFDAAEDGGAVLLFDEADTLFGKRSEVRDSHDRYANLEVGYLLQRMESFRGLAVLTTNARSALDPAFTRRLRSVIPFPYPDPVAREALWRGAFPAATPVDGLDLRRLASIDLPGGGIASVALAAAYLAAADGGVVTEEHVRTATRWELGKSGRSAAVPGGTS